MSDHGFVEFLSAVWEQRGWETGINEDEPGQFMITGDRNSGERGLMLVLPDENASVAGQPVQSVASICDAKNVDVAVAATRGEFTDDAQRIAEANDIHLLDPSALEATVAEEGLQDLVDEYAADGSSGGSLLSLPSFVPSPSPPSIPTRLLTVLFVVVGVIALAVVGTQLLGIGTGPLGLLGQLPGDVLAGGSGGDDLTVTAVSLTGSAEDSVEVAWNTKTTGAIVTANETRYEAPDGEKFVVVQMEITNDRPATSSFDASMLGFAANDTVREPRTLNGTSDRLPLELAPEESATTWVVFTIDKGESSGTLIGLPGENTPPLRFTHDPSVEADVELD